MTDMTLVLTLLPQEGISQEGTRRKGHCDGEEPGSRPDGVRVGCIHFVDFLLLQPV